MLRHGCGPHYRGVFHSRHTRTNRGKLPVEQAKADIRTVVSHSNTAPTPSLKAADNKKKLMSAFADHFKSQQ